MIGNIKLDLKEFTNLFQKFSLYFYSDFRYFYIIIYMV